MDRLLAHQIISALTKSPADTDRVQSLFDRMLTITKDAAVLGQILWYCIKQQDSSLYVLNRLLESGTKWNLASVVNYAHTDCGRVTTPLHVASNSTNLPLIELLLQLGADVWRPTTHGQVPLHFAIKQLNRNNELAEVCKIIQILCRQMTIVDLNHKPEELFRKFSIIPAAIEANEVAVLKIISQCELKFDYRLYLEYFEYALQSNANEEVTGHLLEQMKSCNETGENMTSPIGMALQYNNLRAVLQSIQLGFSCSVSLFDNGFILLRRVLISERHADLFAIATRCYHYLMRQLVQVSSHLEDPKVLKILYQFVSYKLSFKVCYRVNDPEVTIQGNYLTFGLLTHSMAQWLAQLPVPVQFPVETNLLRYYRFSRHDEQALRCLIQQGRLFSERNSAKLVSYFQLNCQPLYDTSIATISELDNLDAASQEYAQDRVCFQQFCDWLGQYTSEPKSLVILTRNVIINQYWNLVSDDNCQSSLLNVSIVAQRIQHLQKHLGKELFATIFCFLDNSVHIEKQ